MEQQKDNCGTVQEAQKKRNSWVRRKSNIMTDSIIPTNKGIRHRLNLDISFVLLQKVKV